MRCKYPGSKSRLSGRGNSFPQQKERENNIVIRAENDAPADFYITANVARS